MKYYRLIPEYFDSGYLLHSVDRKTGILSIREMYADLTCPKCRKIDEYMALRREISPDISLGGRTDLAYTEDSLFCLSPRFQEVLIRHGIGGLELFSIPNSGGYAAVIPHQVPVDVEAASRFGLKGLGPCRHCGRFRETVGHVPLNAICPPENPKVLFEPGFRLEGRRGLRAELWASELVTEILEVEGLTGFEAEEETFCKNDQ